MPAAGWPIGFRRVENNSVTESDLTTGEFALAGIWPGAFTLNSVSVFSPEPVAFDGRIQQPNETVDLILRLQATSRVTGRVLLPDGVTRRRSRRAGETARNPRRRGLR